MDLRIMADRIRSRRAQLGLTLDQVSRVAGVVIGYLSQLEKGVKRNPTTDTLSRIASALGVSLGWILGEVAFSAPGELGEELLAKECGRNFKARFTGLAAAERERLERGTPELRFATVVSFACHHYPYFFTPLVMAYALGIPHDLLQQILNGSETIGHSLAANLNRVTGVSIFWILTGQFNERLDSLPLDVTLAYLGAVTEAITLGVSEEDVIALIKRRSADH